MVWNKKCKVYIDVFLLIVFSTILTACKDAFTIQEPSVIVEEANVETVTLLVLGQTPVQVYASFTGTYPNDCTMIFEVEEGWKGDTYKFTIMTKRPIADENCVKGPIPFEDRYPVPVHKLKAGEYIIEVNGVQEILEFVFDNE